MVSRISFAQSFKTCFIAIHFHSQFPSCPWSNLMLLHLSPWLDLEHVLKEQSSCRTSQGQWTHSPKGAESHCHAGYAGKEKLRYACNQSTWFISYNFRTNHSFCSVIEGDHIVRTASGGIQLMNVSMMNVPVHSIQRVRKRKRPLANFIKSDASFHHWKGLLKSKNLFRQISRRSIL